MVVASDGAVAAPSSGTDLIDSMPIGASRTVEAERLRAARERELQMTVMEIDGVAHVVRKHDVIFLAPGIEHSIANSGLTDLVFLVITSPVTDDAAPA